MDVNEQTILELRKELANAQRELASVAKLSRQEADSSKYSEARYRRLFESAPDGILIFDAVSGRIEDVNPALCQLLDDAPEDFVGKKIGGINSFRTIAANQDAFCALQEGNCIRYDDLPIETKEGRNLFVEFVGSAYVNADKKFIECNIRDNTQRKQVEGVKDFLSSIVESSEDSIVTVDLESIITSWNKSAERLYGYSALEAIGKHLTLLTLPEDLQKVLSNIDSIKHSETVEIFDSTHLNKDGRELHLEVALSPIKDSTGRVIGISTIARDIAQKQQIIEALRESEAQFRTLAEAVPQIVWITRADGYNTYFSQQWMDYTGLTLEESLGHGWNKPFHPDDQQRAWDAWQHATATIGTYSIESRLRRADGVYRWWLIRGVPLQDADGNIVKWFGTCTDIHDMKQAELKISQSNKEQRDLAERLEKEKSRLIEAQTVAKVGSWELDIATNILTWSDETYRIFEIDRDNFDASYDAFLELIHPDDRASVHDTYQESVANHVAYAMDHRLLCTNGRLKIVHERCQTFYDEHGRATRSMGTVQDITERKETEVLLEESRQRLALATESARIGIWDWDVVTNKLVWDAQMYALYGIREQDFSGAYDAWQSGLHPEDREKAEADANAALDSNSSRIFHPQFRVVWPNGEVRHIEAHAVVQRANDGSALRMIGVNWDITEREQNAEALRLSIQRFELLSRATNDAVWDWNLLTNEVWWNEAFETLFGYDRKSIEPDIESWKRRMHPEDLNKVSNGIHALIESGQQLWWDEYRFRKADGSYATIFDRGFVIRDEHQQPVRMVGSMQDVTERKQAEEALRESEEHLRFVVDASHDGIWEWEIKDGKLIWSERIYTLLGLSPEHFEPSYQTQRALIHPDDLAPFERAIEAHLETQQPYNVRLRYRRSDGTYIHILSQGKTQRDAQGQPLRMIGSFSDLSSLMQAEAEREAKSREIVTIWESMTDAFFSLDAQWCFTQINSQATQRMQWNAEELIGKNLWEVFPDAVNLKFYTEFQRAVKEQVPVNAEEFFAPHNAWYEFHAYPAPLGLSAYFRDITERKQAEIALSASEAKFQNIMANVPGTVYQFVLNPDGSVEIPFVNESCRELFEREPDELQRNPTFPLEVIHPADRARAGRLMAESAERLLSWSWEGRIKLPSGKTKWVQGASRPQRLPNGGTLWDGLLVDITARKEAEEERDRFFTMSLDMLSIAGFDGYFKRVNPAFLETLGYTEAELMEKPSLEFVHPEDRDATLAARNKLFTGEGLVGLVNRYLSKDGSWRWLEWKSVAALEEGLVYAAARDVTERKKAEQALLKANDELELHVMERTAELGAANESLQLELAEHHRTMETLRQVAEALQLAKEEADTANAAKSEFLSRMSHELRTPLNAILGFGQILDRQNLTTLQSESVNHILTGGRHLLALVNEILDIARVEAGHSEMSLEPVSVPNVVAECCALVQPLAQANQIQIVNQLVQHSNDLTPHYVMADRQRLKQVILNLLSNAIKYNRPQGEVKISVNPVSAARLQIRVSDSGEGLSSEDVKKLFTPFERLHAANSSVEGTGLGLVISQRLVTAMGGTLDVETSSGQGSTFWIELPATNVLSMVPCELSAQQAQVRQGAERIYTVLCIEDNPSNLRLMAAIFKMRPQWTLLTTTQGSMGLDVARQHEPDLILLDLNLPDMHGQEVLARLQQSALTRDIPIIIVSADASSSQVEQLLCAGAKAYLTKPLDVEQLLSTLEQFLQERPHITEK